MPASDVISTLTQLTSDLWLPSETEVPWTIATWSVDTLAEDVIRQKLQRKDSAPIAKLSLAALEIEVEQRCQSYGPVGKRLMAEHRQLFNFLKQTCDRVRVLRVGTVTVDILVVGELEDEAVILQTQSIET
ncbi:MAG: nuclease A inhibitor family protein [Leptolyngbyaceae cyanobacterium]